MKNGFISLVVILLLAVGMICQAEEAVDDELDYAISQAVLDGCGDLPFLISCYEPMFEVLVEAHEILQIEKQDGIYTVWLLASAGVFRREDPDGIRGNPAKANMPIMVKLVQTNNGYLLIEYNEPAPGTWGEDIHKLFPEGLLEKVYAGNPWLFDSLESLADRYFTDPTSTGFWCTTVSTDQDDPAVRAVLERFSRYPQWEGRSILTRSQTEQLWFYLSIDGENGYRSPCTFEKYDKDGRSLAYAVVQYANDQLILLEGEFPMEDE